MDSGLDHRYIFTMAMSIFVACDSEQEIDVLHDKLSEGGEEKAPLEDAIEFYNRALGAGGKDCEGHSPHDAAEILGRKKRSVSRSHSTGGGSYRTGDLLVGVQRTSAVRQQLMSAHGANATSIDVRCPVAPADMPLHCCSLERVSARWDCLAGATVL